MTEGTEIDHLADQALRTGFAQALWLALRNAYFKHGTQEDGWAAMEQAFMTKGVLASLEQRGAQPHPVEWVVLRPAPDAKRSQEQASRPMASHARW